MYQRKFHTVRRLVAGERDAIGRASPGSWWKARPAGLAAVAAATALMVAACGAGSGGARSSPLGLIDRANRTVQLNLVVTDSDIDGYSAGQMTVRVPRGWRVDVFCSNQASTPQSCAVVSGAHSTSPVFAGAASPRPRAGLRAGRLTDFSFVVSATGSYRVASLVPGGEDHGMWDRFDVTAAGAPSVSIGPWPATERIARDMHARRNS